MKDNQKDAAVRKSNEKTKQKSSSKVEGMTRASFFVQFYTGVGIKKESTTTDDNEKE